MLILSGGPSFAQDAVAVGEPKATASLTGEVRGTDGSLPGVQVTAENLGTGQRYSTVTDAASRFRLPNLSPGRYRVTATAQGFATTSRETTLVLGAATNLVLSLAGPVPVGEARPEGASPATPARTPAPLSASPATTPAAPRAPIVIEKPVGTDVELQTWLNEEAARGHSLEAVVPLKMGTSLFVLRETGGTVSPPVVLMVAGSPSASPLEARLRAHPSRRTVGLHVLSAQAFLVVLVDGNR